MDKAKEDYEKIIAKFDSEVSRALESPHVDFDENNDDDSEDLDLNFKDADPEPEHSATVDMQGPVARDSYKQDEIVDKNPMYSYDGKKREGVYDANKDRKGSNETVYRSRSGLINGTETYETVDVDFSETDSAVEFTCNCGVRVTEENLPKHMAEAHGSKLTEARYKTYKTQHNIGINESDANVNDIGLGKKTRAGESLAKEGAYDNLPEDAKSVVADHYDNGISREDREDWAKMSGGSATPDTKFVDLSKEIQDIWVESWDYDKESKAKEGAWGSDTGKRFDCEDCDFSSNSENKAHKHIENYAHTVHEKWGESLAKEDIHFGISDHTSGGSPSEQQDAFNSAFGVSTPEEEEQIEDSIDDKMNPIESAYFDIKSEYWESFIDDPVKLDEFLQRVESLRADAQQAVATIPRRRSGFYTRRNFDEVEWLNTVINDMQGIIRQAEPMKNNGLFESFPRGNVGESLAREDQIHTQDGWWRNMQDIDFNWDSLQKAIADIETAMNGASTSEMIQLQQEYDYYTELLRKFTQDKDMLEQQGMFNLNTPDYSTAPWGIYESNAKAVWKSYEMEDEYETQMHGQGWNTETDEEEDDQSKVSLNINDGTLTDKQIETEEHHTKSDKDSTSPDDEGFSTSNIASGNYEKVIGYNPESKIWWDQLPMNERQSITLFNEIGDADLHKSYDELDDIQQWEISTAYMDKFITHQAGFNEKERDNFIDNTIPWDGGGSAPPMDSYFSNDFDFKDNPYNFESKVKESMEDEVGVWWDSMSPSEREQQIPYHQADNWEVHKNRSWQELQSKLMNHDGASTAMADARDEYTSKFFANQGLDDEQNAQAGGDWDGNYSPSWSNSWRGALHNDNLTTKSGNILNYESKAIEKWTDDELGSSYWEGLSEQDRTAFDEDGFGKVSHLSWNELPEQFKINLVQAIREDEYFTESHAIEVSSEEEEVGSDLWQALAEGNLLGDYVFGGIFNFEITMPNWATDPQMDVGSIGWFELSDADKQNVVNHFGGVDGMKEKLCDEGWGSYCDEIESYESKAREYNEWEYEGVNLADHMDIEEEGGRTYATCQWCGWHEEWENSDTSGDAPVDVISNHLRRKHNVYRGSGNESKAREDDPDFLNDPDYQGYTEDEFGNKIKSHPSQYTIGGMDFAEKELKRNRGDIDDDIIDNPTFNFESLQKKYSMCDSCMDKAFKSLTNESQMADTIFQQSDFESYEDWESYALANGVSQQEAIDTWEKFNPSYGFESKRF